MGDFQGQKPLLTKKNILMIPETFWEKIFCGLTRQKLSFLKGLCPVTSGIKLTQHKNNKHGGGSVTVRGCFAALGPRRLAVIDRTKNSALCQKILKENARPLFHALKIKHSWVMQQDNDPKYTCPHLNGHKKPKMMVLEWSSQSGLKSD